MNDWPFGLLVPGTFGAIHADCPWQYRGYVSEGVPQRAQEQHYPTMHLDELKALPVADLARRNCALFMWSISSHTPQAFELGGHWGFKFSGKAFCWAKRSKTGKHWHMGLGHGTRRNTEDCWLFLRGQPKRLDKGVRELIVAPVREHSRKPEETYDLIQRLVAGPYLDLFGRAHRPGWTVWGNQVGKF